MKKVNNEKIIGERAEFFAKDVCYTDCNFFDGESPLKESSDITLKDCEFGWKYPLWYAKRIHGNSLTFLESARSGIWYSEDVVFKDCIIKSPKMFRCCKRIKISNTSFGDAAETFWSCKNVQLNNVAAKGDYFGLDCKKLQAKKLYIDGNYCFNGASNLNISESILNSKDAFWNVKNALVINSTIIGEYIGWNSENLTFVNCIIESHQGFCYIKGLKLINCIVRNTDLAFEYCEDVDADIVGKIDSVKNPISGRIVADDFGEIIMESDRVDSSKTVIIKRQND